MFYFICFGRYFYDYAHITSLSNFLPITRFGSWNSRPCVTVVVDRTWMSRENHICSNHHRERIQS